MTWNTGIPATGNQIVDDVADIKENFDCLGPYKTIWVGANDMWAPTTTPAAAGTAETTTNDIMTKHWAFAKDADDFVDFNLVMPPNWNRGTIKAKFFWSGATSSSTGDTVEWEIKAVAIGDDDALDATWGTAVAVSDALLADNGTDLQISPASAAITVGGTPALGDLLHFKVSRDVDGTDNMTENAYLFGVLIQYTISETITTAWS